jgi:hypothetical protein
MVIGLVAIVHVIISHGVAIGLIAIVTLAEYLGVQRKRPEWEAHAERMLKPAVIIITGVGAVTGAGIWFTTSALNPRGIASLLRIFFWPWFLEWIVFTLEVVAILYYYFQWNRWTDTRKKNRWLFGAVYVGLASFSAVLITGILGFMLTSDGWPWNKTFVSAFFNPSFLPQLLFRLAISMVLGSLLAISFLLYSRYGADFRARALRVYGTILLVSSALTAGFASWYFAIVPSRFKTQAAFAVLTSHLSRYPHVFWLINAAGLALLCPVVAACLARKQALSRILVIPALVAAMGFVAEFERIREFIRGPYVIPGYMYSNQMLVGEEDYFRQKGLLEGSPWYSLAGRNSDETSEAAFLFMQNCSSCHTIGGINNIARRARGRSRDGIAVILSHTHEMVPFMPPFSGTPEERLMLAGFLYQLSQGEVRLRPSARLLPPESKIKR